MKNLFIYCLLILFASCETVSKKIDDQVSKEEAELSKWLNSTETKLKMNFGKPDKISFKENSRNRFYVYISKKYTIKCEREFEIDQENKIVGFKSKNCF